MPTGLMLTLVKIPNTSFVVDSRRLFWFTFRFGIMNLMPLGTPCYARHDGFFRMLSSRNVREEYRRKPVQSFFEQSFVYSYGRKYHHILARF